MRIPRIPRVRTAFVGLLLLAALLAAACGQSTSRPGALSQPTATRQPTATPTLVATATPTLQPTATPAQAASGCAVGGGANLLRAGDLVISPIQLTNVSYPSQHIPDSTPLKPYAFTTNNLGALFPDSTPTNPSLAESAGAAGGYAFIVCNDSPTQSHTIRAISVKLATLTPYTGQLNTYQACDGFYARPGPATFGGCGGGFITDEYLHATFASSAGAGVAVTATQTKTGSSFGRGSEPPLPDTLAPGHTVGFVVGLTAPTASGTYTFSFGVTIDNGAPVYFGSAPATLLAPVAHKWTGPACEKPAMLAQIPTTVTNPPTRYICPES